MINYVEYSQRYRELPKLCIFVLNQQFLEDILRAAEVSKASSWAPSLRSATTRNSESEAQQIGEGDSCTFCCIVKFGDQ